MAALADRVGHHAVDADRGQEQRQVWGDDDQQRPFASLGSSPPGAIPVTAVLHQGLVRDVRVGSLDPEAMAKLLERLLAE